jgi:hypothetical protein
MEPTPSDHALKISDWIARLASAIENFVFSIATTRKIFTGLHHHFP